MDDFEKAVQAFLDLPLEEQRKRIDEARRWAEEASAAFDRAISFTSEEARRLLHMPITI